MEKRYIAPSVKKAFEILQVISLSREGMGVSELARDLKSLGDKLPRELCTGDEPLNLSDHDWLKEVVLATRGDLAQRLLETEHDS